MDAWVFMFHFVVAVLAGAWTLRVLGTGYCLVAAAHVEEMRASECVGPTVGGTAGLEDVN